jgi:Protein of unknown function (DUF4230)
MARRERRERRSVFSALFVGFGVALAIVVSAVFAFSMLGNPFKTKQVDRSGPALLTTLSDIAQYKAATADLDVLVDIEDDVRFLPSVVAGSRTLFRGVGSVDGLVDFSHLDAQHLQVSADRKSVTITLPAATYSEVHIDADKSGVIDRNRGLVNRLSGIFNSSPTGDKKLYQATEKKLQAAAAESELKTRAEDNTRKMLEGLLGGLGFEHVDVQFEPAAPT